MAVFIDFSAENLLLRALETFRALGIEFVSKRQVESRPIETKERAVVSQLVACCTRSARVGFWTTLHLARTSRPARGTPQGGSYYAYHQRVCHSPRRQAWNACKAVPGSLRSEGEHPRVSVVPF